MGMQQMTLASEGGPPAGSFPARLSSGCATKRNALREKCLSISLDLPPGRSSIPAQRLAGGEACRSRPRFARIATRVQHGRDAA
jgi:hypothetical protein